MRGWRGASSMNAKTLISRVAAGEPPHEVLDLDEMARKAPTGIAGLWAKRRAPYHLVLIHLDDLYTESCWQSGEEITTARLEQLFKKHIVGQITMWWDGDCDSFTVGTSAARHGYGPLLYDLAMWKARQESAGEGLMPDRSSVSYSAGDLWAYYFKNRKDVKKTELPSIGGSGYPDEHDTGELDDLPFGDKGLDIMPDCWRHGEDELDTEYYILRRPPVKEVEANGAKLLKFLASYEFEEAEVSKILRKVGGWFFNQRPR
jgi:hypothetical protein